MRRHLVIVIFAFVCAGLSPQAAQAANLLLRPQPSVAPQVICTRYGWTLISALETQHLYLVDAPAVTAQSAIDAILAADKEVMGLEFSVTMQAPPVPGGAALTQSVAAILESYQTTFMDYYGGSAWDYYLTQSAAEQLHIADAHKVATGTGIIAIIDTGVDPTHPALQNVIVPGYDFTRDVEGGSEWSDVPDLTQSVAAILEQYYTVTLNQSVAAILEGGTVPPPPLPAYFGHGTMVAGIAHLTAPTSRIMPLKAFTADGSTTLYNIVRAIYYAADHDARVINMSFVSMAPSKELSQALQYAVRKGAIPIAAVGNGGFSTDMFPVYPADYRVSFGIGSTQGNKRSTFSNYGGDVKVGTPGEGLLTTFPGGIYAMVWGTSFSAGWASGSVALFAERNQWLSIRDVDSAFSNGATRMKSSEGMGAGRLDVYKATVSVLVK
jgi:subtilisin family serine protease